MPDAEESLLSGWLTAITPTALYVSSGVSPAGMEISSATSLWAAGLALVVTDGKEADPSACPFAGLAAVVLVWTRDSVAALARLHLRNIARPK